VPHCIIEHSNNFEPSALITAVFKGAQQSKLFEDSDIKTRTITFEHYQTGLQSQSFVHVTTKILSGRNLAQRQMLSQLILVQLESLNMLAVSLTVEVVEIEKASYAKVVV